MKFLREYWAYVVIPLVVVIVAVIVLVVTGDDPAGPFRY